MSNIDEITTTIGPRIREAASNFLTPLQTTRVLKRDAFEELDASVKSLVRELKCYDLVPKSLLNEIYVTSRVLKNEAPYFKDEAATLENMAGRLEMSLGLILLGESHEDRVPGVPRLL